MEVKNQPIAKAEFLIRKPVAEVFEAFVDPEIITKFWFNRSTGWLESGKTVQWHWDLSIFQSKDEPEMGQGGKGQSAGRGSPF